MNCNENSPRLRHSAVQQASVGKRVPAAALPLPLLAAAAAPVMTTTTPIGLVVAVSSTASDLLQRLLLQEPHRMAQVGHEFARRCASRPAPRPAGIHIAAESYCSAISPAGARERSSGCRHRLSRCCTASRRWQRNLCTTECRSSVPRGLQPRLPTRRRPLPPAARRRSPRTRSKCLRMRCAARVA